MTALLNQDITLKTSELISSWHGVYHTTVCLWSRFSLMMEMTITKLIQVINEWIIIRLRTMLRCFRRYATRSTRIREAGSSAAWYSVRWTAKALNKQLPSNGTLMTCLWSPAQTDSSLANSNSNPFFSGCQSQFHLICLHSQIKHSCMQHTSCQQQQPLNAGKLFLIVGSEMSQVRNTCLCLFQYEYNIIGPSM